MDLRVGHICDRGLNPKRPVNQDKVLALPQQGLFAVFDGVGGQRAGEVASQTAAETIEEVLSSLNSNAAPAEVISRAIQFANRDILELASSNQSYRTMATTVALLHINGDRATIAHVGDSRVYRLDNGLLSCETMDHTDLNDQIRAGVITAEQAAALGESHVINRALGVDPYAEIEMKSIVLREGVRFLLCTDGVYRHISGDQLARVLAGNLDPQEAAEELKRIVYDRGADDNLTAIVVEVGRAEVKRGRDRAAAGDVRSIPRTATAATRKQRSPSIGGRGAAAAPSRNRRIQVEFDTREKQKRPKIEENNGETEASVARSSPDRGSLTGKLIRVLLVLVAVGGAFYAGMRASSLMARGSRAYPAPAPGDNAGSSRSNAATYADLMHAGQDAFEHGNYQAATVAFVSALEREPQSSVAYYWLGRAQLEQNEYSQAARSLERAATLAPVMHDAYVQAAAAWEAAGNKAKARELLTRSGEVRRKQSSAAPATGR